MAKQPTKKTRATENAGSNGTAKGPQNAALDTALFVPRLDQLELLGGALEGMGPAYSEMFESICGVVDDSQQVELYNGTLGVSTAFVAARQHAVAQVQWNDNLGSVFTNPGDVSGVRWGSGTMIGPDLFLTCGHLFDAAPNGWVIPRQNGTSNAVSPQTAALNMHLNFEYQVDPSGTLRAEQRFPITQLVEYRLGGLDMALCRIGGSPGNTYGWSEFATSNATVGTMLAIIGHPLGQPKRIEAGPATQLSGSTIRYNDIDTLGGNSGSGILASPSGRVVGVHTNGGCNSAGTGSNSGVAIAAILAASPTLQGITPSSHTTRAADSFGTALAADIGTVRAADLQINTGIRDFLGTRLAADLNVHTFGGGDDPVNTWVEGIIDPGKPLFDPAILSGPKGLRPFVQAGPHAPIEGAADGEASGSAVLAEIEGLIAINAAVGASLQALLVTLGAVSQDSVQV